VRYLLDVNVLVALGVRQHQFYDRMENWVREQPKSTQLLTSSIVELGFVRILSQVTAYDFSVREAIALLGEMKKFWSLQVYPDAREALHLPKWVKSHQQVTDGHLVDVAQAHGALLATFDKQIPSAFLIP
jgi:predicted nucleic acid-binding protein